MKPGVSLATTVVLPSDLPNSWAVRSVSSLVRMVRTSSKRGMIGGGLKKCIPNTLSGRLVAEAISVMQRLEVLLARMAWGGQMASNSAKTCFLTSIFSTTASITRSQGAKSSILVVPWMRARAASISSWVSLPRCTPLAMDLRMRSKPFCRSSSFTSRTTTSYPLRAQTSAMPEPMSPQPTTPIFLISIADLLSM